MFCLLAEINILQLLYIILPSVVSCHFTQTRLSVARSNKNIPRDISTFPWREEATPSDASQLDLWTVHSVTTWVVAGERCGESVLTAVMVSPSRYASLVTLVAGIRELSMYNSMKRVPNTS